MIHCEDSSPGWSVCGLSVREQPLAFTAGAPTCVWCAIDRPVHVLPWFGRTTISLINPLAVLKIELTI